MPKRQKLGGSRNADFRKKWPQFIERKQIPTVATRLQREGGWEKLNQFLTQCTRSFETSTTFSSPEPTILLVCARDRDLWQGPKQEVRESRTSGFCAQPQKFGTITVTIGYKNGQLLLLRVTWPLPEVSIRGADHKDRGLWGRECFNNNDLNYLVSVFIARQCLWVCPMSKLILWSK